MSETAESAQKDVSLFEDEPGQAALAVFAKLDDNLSRLEQNLDRQFNDSHDEDDDAEDVKSTHSHTDSHTGSQRESESETSTTTNSSGAETQEDFDALIAALNRHDALREEKKAQLRHSLAARPQTRDLSSSDEDERETARETLRERDTEAAPQNFVGKIFDLIRTLQQREASPTVDEWDNDEDSGYITISLSQQEFVEFEEVCICTCVFVVCVYIYIYIFVRVCLCLWPICPLYVFSYLCFFLHVCRVMRTGGSWSERRRRRPRSARRERRRTSAGARLSCSRCRRRCPCPAR